MKRLLCAMLALSLLLCALASCSFWSVDLVSVAHTLKNEKNYVIEIGTGDDFVEDRMSELGVDFGDAACLLIVLLPGYGDMEYDYRHLGFFVQCREAEDAAALMEEMLLLAKEERNEFAQIENFVIRDFGKVLFVGCGDILADANLL